ncbi:hypothetical protein [Nocardia asteroides]|nr:hypothetical protein [Nocardia asteroides]SFN82147.1 hypothetical protein SAMN05444423_11531 [Nocardia asteroides]
MGPRQFRILEIDDDRALIRSTLQEAPGAHPRSMRLTDLIPAASD